MGGRQQGPDPNTTVGEFLAQLGNGAMRLDFETGGSRWFFVGGGFAQMKDDKLSLVAEEATPADEIVRAKADDDLKKAIATVARSDEEIEKKMRSIKRAKEMAAIMAEALGWSAERVQREIHFARG